MHPEVSSNVRHVVSRVDIHRDIVSMWVYAFQTEKVVVFCGIKIGGGVLANVDTKLALVASFQYLAYQMIDAFVVESHAIDQRRVIRQTEQAWSGIAILRPRCNGADFDMSEAKCTESINIVSVLVEPSGESNAVVKTEPQTRNWC